jgi:hypothetical protein
MYVTIYSRLEDFYKFVYIYLTSYLILDNAPEANLCSFNNAQVV